ncbi:MAG: sensor histidine kinase [Noviherbaspirillum sp.]
MYSSRRFVKSLLTSTAWWLGVAASLVLQLMAARMIDDKARAHFDYRAASAQHAIQNRMRSYIDVLRGTAALFDTGHDLTRAQFRAYVTALHLERNFPGVRNLNFAQWVPAGDKNAFESGVRNDASITPGGYPDFAIAAAGERPDSHVVTYVEPMESNHMLLGIDLASNASITPALAASRDSGQLLSSGRIVRILDQHRQVGLSMRMPLYRRGMPLDDVEQRRAAYYGSIGAGFDIDKLMLGAIDRETLRYVRVRLYDSGQDGGHDDGPHTAGSLDPDNLLFDSIAEVGGQAPQPEAPASAGHFTKRVTMTVGQRVWEMEFAAPRAAIVSGIDHYLPWLVLVGALATSTLLYSIYYSLMTARRHALELARDMTKDLRTSEASLAKAQHMARLGSWVLDPGSGKMTWSEETYRIFGVGRSAGLPNYDDFLHHIHADDRQKLRDGLDQSITSGGECALEHRIEQRDGSVRWVQTISRLGYDNRNMLLRGTIMDVTERKQTVEALKRSQELLRELTAHQDRVKEEERKRIAREIHDELGQTLLALRIDVSMLAARTAKNHPRLNGKVRDALQHLDATVKTIRTIINNLRPAVLDLGLNAAIEWQVAEFRRRTGITCELRMSPQDFMVGDARATPLFRILQESLTNVIRHARATRVLIELYKKDQRLILKIADNGVGIHPKSLKTANSFGLVGMEERIHALNGEFRISSAPGNGTTLIIYIPLEHDNALDDVSLADSEE